MNDIDLHIHTSYSDGEYTPYQIIDIAKQNNVKTISVTDHDTVEAYSEQLFKYARENDIEVIKGVEISTRYNGIGIHVLGYNLDLHNKDLLDTLSKLKNARLNYYYDVSKK